MSQTPMPRLDKETRKFFRTLIDDCAAIAAEHIAEARDGTLERKDKGSDTRLNGDPVTIADQRIQALIIKRLSKRYPGIGVHGEEQAGNREPAASWPQLRVIFDPLDGTRGFGIGHPHHVVCNFAIQQRDSADAGWEIVLAGANAPQKDMAIMMDQKHAFVRKYSHFKDHKFHPMKDFRPHLPNYNDEKTVPDVEDFRNMHIDLRMVGHEEQQRNLEREWQKRKITTRNCGAMVAVMLDFMQCDPAKVAMVNGAPGGVWDWLPGTHYLRAAGIDYSELVVHPKMGPRGEDYPVFIAAGTKRMFDYLKGAVARTLDRGMRTDTPEMAAKGAYLI